MRMICGTILVAALAAAGATAAEAPTKSAVVCATSPDGRVKCEFFLEDGRPVADVSFCGRHAFRSELGMDFGRVKLAKSDSRTIRSSWKPVWGFKSEYPENYTELEL
ncbi:MAG: glycoside hydrolase family 97 N-terminal domain-containing protein, partial [Kiritimatiellae bacterium]|nr:glycoside hydrolase family 97 N-terminal domain-containing protein [Kiritimatiellia bacterium]